MFKIAILEDDFVTREALNRILQRIGKKNNVVFETYISSNGLDFFGILLAENPHIIVVDTSTPQYGGRDFLQYLITNPRFQKSKWENNIIVLDQEDNQQELPSNYVRLNKAKVGHLENMLTIILGRLRKEKEERATVDDKLLLSFGENAIKWSNKSDRLMKQIQDSKVRNRPTQYIVWSGMQLAAIANMVMLYISSESGHNNDKKQRTHDKWQYRIRYYPAATAFISAFLFVLFHFVLLIVGQVTFMNIRVHSIFADNSTQVTVALGQVEYNSEEIIYEGGEIKLAPPHAPLVEGGEVTEPKEGVTTYSIDKPSVVFTQGIEYSTLAKIYEDSSQNSFESSTMEVPKEVWTLQFPTNGITYQISPDLKTWYFFNGIEWVPTEAGWLTSNSVQELNAGIKNFSTPTKTIYLKAFLHSDGTYQTILRDIVVERENKAIVEVKDEPIPTDIPPIDIQAQNLISQLKPVILNASWYEGEKIVSGRVDLPQGLDLKDSELPDLKVKIFYTDSTDYKRSATSEGQEIGITGVNKITTQYGTQYVFTLRTPSNPGGHVSAKIIYKGLESDYSTAVENSTYYVNEEGDQADVITDGDCDYNTSLAGSQCTLRAAIQEANLNAGADNIFFAIPGGGNFIIQPSTSNSTTLGGADAITIDASTQSNPGFESDCTTLDLQVTLDGSLGVTPHGFTVYNTNVTIKGLVITNFPADGILFTSSAANATAQCNIIGLEADGVTSAGNSRYGVYTLADNFTVGGPNLGEGNVISSNSTGIVINNTGSNNSLIQGNKVGTDRSGSIARGNTSGGIQIGGGTGHLIGGNNTGGSNCSGECNLISGNTSAGIIVSGEAEIYGNFIGTSLDGQSSIANTNGIQIENDNVTVGDGTTNHRNIISGNTDQGFYVVSGASVYQNRVIDGNYICTNSTGDAALPNGDDGIRFLAGLANAYNQNDIVRNNLISGCNDAGISIEVASKSISIYANKIGTAANGIDSMPNSTGIYYVNVDTLVNSEKILIGESGQDPNIIANNTSYAIRLVSKAYAQIENNSIYSNGSGIRVESNTTTANILDNYIYNNTGLGLDLFADGISTNDTGDADSGPNGLQNYPVLDAWVAPGADTEIYGSFNSQPSVTYRLDFWANTLPDGAGNGEGEEFLGNTYITTDGSGNYDFSLTPITLVGIQPTGGKAYLSAVATVCSDPPGCTTLEGTSEFSNNATISSRVSGTIYDDVNGNGEIDLGETGISGVAIKIYLDDGDDTPDAGDSLYSTTSTDIDGEYSKLLPSNTYWIAVDSTTVTPTTPYIGAVLADQTYGSTDARCSNNAGGTTLLSTPGYCFGGARPNTTDNPATLTTSEHVTKATVHGSDVTGVDSGFSFIIMTNTNDSGQGTLRQTIINTNSLTGPQAVVFNLPSDDSNYNNNATGTTTDDFWRITPSTAIDTITDELVLDASTQDTSSCNPLIPKVEIKKATPGGFTGLTVSSDNVEIRGFVVNHFTTGIYVSTSSDNVKIACNIIGLNHLGTSRVGNTGTGIYLTSSSSAMIGGSDPSDRNIVSGNASGNIKIISALNIPNDNNIITGNYIGTDITGLVSLSPATNNSIDISGSTPYTGTIISNNVISGHQQTGIVVNYNAESTTIIENFIGVGSDGVTSIAAPGYGTAIQTVYTRDTLIEGNIIKNHYIGVYISGGQANGLDYSIQVLDNEISDNRALGLELDYVDSDALVHVKDNMLDQNGDFYGIYTDHLTPTSPKGILIESNTVSNTQSSGGVLLVDTRAYLTDNTITGNAGNGIDLQSFAAISDPDSVIINNRIYDNDGIGIDFDLDGVTLNDAGMDSDIGVNEYQNYPELDGYQVNGGDLDIYGSFHSLANTQFRIDFYSNTSGDNSGNGEGEQLLGYAIINTDSDGNYNFSIIPITLASVSLPSGQDFVSSTATICQTAPECDDLGNATSEFGNTVSSLPEYTLSGEILVDPTIDGNIMDAFALPPIDQTVKAYLDSNENGVPDNSDILKETVTNSTDGSFSFSVHSGTYWIVTHPGEWGVNQGASALAEQIYSSAGGLCYDPSDDTTKIRDDFGDCVGGKNADISDDNALEMSEHVIKVVVTNQDVSDITFAFSYDIVTNTNPTGQGSLYQTLDNFNSSNNFGRTGSVKFALNSFDANYNGSWWTVPFAQNNSFMLGDIVIDGYSQTGSAANSSAIGEPLNTNIKVQIDLQGDWAIDGGNSVTLRGLAIKGDYDITVSSPNTRVEGSLFGIAPDGQCETDVSRLVFTSASTSSVIGTDADSPEVVDANINVFGCSSSSESINAAFVNSTVRGNYIGTDMDINNTNNQEGLVLSGGFDSVRVTENIIAMNLESGLLLTDTGANTYINKNQIYSNDTGIKANTTDIVIEENDIHDNFANGIETTLSASNITITNNQIHNNYGIGLNIGDAQLTLASNNSFYENTDLGIDIENVGITVNDGYYDNIGTLDFPIFTDAYIESGTLHVEGYIGIGTSPDFQGMLVETYVTDGQELSNGEGKTYIGDCTTDANSSFSCDLVFNEPITPGLQVTGLSINPITTASFFNAEVYDFGDSSEFGDNYTVGHKPLAANDYATTIKNNAVDIDVINAGEGQENGEDIDLDGDINLSSLNITSQPSHGEITGIDFDTGVITYNPDTDYYTAGVFDEFIYEICDGINNCSSATVFVEVLSKPIVENDVVDVGSGQTIAINVLANDSDLDGTINPATLELTGAQGGSDGTIKINEEVNVFEYTAPSNYEGSESFSYKVCDNDSLCSNGTLTTNIDASSPQANDDTLEIDEDQTGTVTVIANDFDSSGTSNSNLDLLTLKIVQNPDQGQAKIGASGVIEYQPNKDYYGIDSLSYIVCDKTSLGCDTAKVSISVKSVNDAPIAKDDSYDMPEIQTIYVDILRNDTDKDSLLDKSSVKIIEKAKYGSAEFEEPSGLLRYEPSLDFSKEDRLKYEVCDEGGLCSRAEVLITGPEIFKVGFLGDIRQTLSLGATLKERLEAVSLGFAIGIAAFDLGFLGVGLLTSPYVLLNTIENFFYLIIGRKKKQTYGFVYNSETKETLPQSVVRAYREDGKLIATDVTDTYGAFRFDLPEGTYKFIVQKKGYTFPSKIVLEDTDYPIENVYHEEYLKIKKDQPINIAIPIDQVKLNKLQRARASINTSLKDYFMTLNTLIFILGLALSIVIYAVLQTKFALFSILAYIPTFLVILITVTRNPIKYGRVVDTTGKPVPNVIIGLRETSFDRLIAKRVTDEKGLYRFIIGPGKYKLEILNDSFTLDENSKKNELVNLTRKKGNTILSRNLKIKSINRKARPSGEK